MALNKNITTGFATSWKTAANYIKEAADVSYTRLIFIYTLYILFILLISSVPTPYSETLLWKYGAGIH